MVLRRNLSVGTSETAEEQGRLVASLDVYTSVYKTVVRLITEDLVQVFKRRTQCVVNCGQ